MSNTLLLSISIDDHLFSVTKEMVIRKKKIHRRGKKQGCLYAYSVKVCVEMLPTVNSIVPKLRQVSTG